MGRVEPMQFDNSFSVQAPIADVFAAVADMERVVPCVPGASVVDRRGDDVYEVALKAQLGPLWRKYFGTITVHRRDDAKHRVELTNRARDAKGRRIGKARIEISLAQLGVHTNVSIFSHVTIVDGMLAEKTIREGATKQMAEFAANLRTMIAGG
jgi:carbon monoxide dehydrogenase subunit G